MPKAKNGNNGLADPSRLPPLDGSDDDTIQVVVETPKGCRNKYAFDQDERIFVLKKVLPAGMVIVGAVTPDGSSSRRTVTGP